jgi:replicative DNA helicase
MTGIASLDAKMGGMGEGEFIYLMAIRNSGKTALALQIAVNVAQRLLADWMGGGWELDPTARLLGDPNKMDDPTLSLSRCPGVLFDSYEMSAELLAGRVIAYLSGVKVRMLRDGKWETDTAFRLRQVELATKHLPLRILDRPGQSAASMAILGRMEARHRPIVLRITDNMRKVVGESIGERGNRNDTTQATSGKWKDDAKHWGRHIVLCHPRADAGRREMGGLQLGDMPYGADNDADQVLGLDRPEMFVAPNPPPKPAGMKDETYANITKHHYERLSAVAGVAYVVSLKAREGATNWSVKLKWDGETTSFTDPWAAPELGGAPITSMDEEI